MLVAPTEETSQTAPIISVLIVDDHPLVRMGLRALIDVQPDMEVTGEASDGPQAITTHAWLRPDITLMDLRMPRMSGPSTITEIRKADPQARIIVLTSYDGDEDVYQAVRAGAAGYLLKGSFPQRTLDAIRHVHAGQPLFATPEVAGRLAARVTGSALNAREIRVLELVARGMTNREIGAALELSEDTIKYHLRHIYAKLGANDRTEAALRAVQRGILTLA
jgi:two-component system NarL family response regulator